MIDDSFDWTPSQLEGRSLEQIRRDASNYYRSQHPPAPSPMLDGLRAFGTSVGGFLGGICVLAVLFFVLWLFVQFIKFLWFF